MIKEEAEKALFSENACNLSGVVHSFSAAMKNIVGDTEFRNNHPIAIIYTATILNLQGSVYPDFGKYCKAAEWCEKAVRGELNDWDYK